MTTAREILGAEIHVPPLTLFRNLGHWHACSQEYCTLLIWRLENQYDTNYDDDLIFVCFTCAHLDTRNKVKSLIRGQERTARPRIFVTCSIGQAPCTVHVTSHNEEVPKVTAVTIQDFSFCRGILDSEINSDLSYWERVATWKYEFFIVGSDVRLVLTTITIG